MKRIAGHLLAGSALLALLVEAWHLKHPLMYWLRPLETLILLLAGLAAGALASGQGKRLRRFYLGVAIVISGLTLGRESEFRNQRDAVLAADQAMQQLGEHFIVGFTDFASVRPLAAKGMIGGIYLTRRNLRGKTFAQVAGEIRALQAVRRRAGLPPLIVAADQEGGPVSHLSPLLERLPPLASLTGTASGDELARQARNYGERQGSGLAALGVTLNFGPVVDLHPPHGDAPGDRLTCVSSRAIASDPEVVTEVARNYIAGLATADVGATLKHFPGLGRVIGDTHLIPAILNSSATEQARERRPFHALSSQTNAAMMLSHVVMPEIDARHAASHSAAVVGDLLRGSWGYQGILITDDLNMGAVYGLGIGRVASEALAAGVDLLLVSYDPEQYFRAMHGAAVALRKGQIDEQKLMDSRRRLEVFRRMPGVPPAT